MASIVEEVKLAACPFCGGQANLKTTGLDSWGKQHYWGKCSDRKCGVSTMALDDPIRASELWNRRA